MNYGKNRRTSRNQKRMDLNQSLQARDDDSLFGGGETQRANALQPYMTTGSINQHDIDHDSILEVDWLRQSSRQKSNVKVEETTATISD